MEIKIENLSAAEIKEKGIPSWPIWEKEVSVFEWSYDFAEEALILEGKVVVTAAGSAVEIKAGDFVTFPKGLTCVWDVKEPVRKHYNFI